MQRDVPIGIKFAIVHRAFRREIDSLLSSRDITCAQLGVLSELRRLEERAAGEINQRELERASHLTHPTMTEIIKKLEQKGYVSCRTDSADRRRKLISSTPKAVELRRDMQAMDQQVLEKMTEGIDSQELETALRVVDAMLDRVLNERSETDPDGKED